MSQYQQTLPRRSLPYALAIGLTSIALLLSLGLEVLISRMIGSFFYIAIAISTWNGGLRPGLVALLLSMLALDYYFLSPIYQLLLHPEDILRLGLFGTVSLIIVLLNVHLKQSQQRIARLNRQVVAESADRLKIALTAAQMGMWDWNLITGEINWSPEHELLFGLDPNSFDGNYATFNDRLHPADRDELNQAVSQALQNRIPYRHEYRVIWSDGSIHWIEGRGQGCYDAHGQAVRMSGTIMNIDDRKQAELALQAFAAELEQHVAARTAELTTFFTHSPIGMTILDEQMRVVKINTAAAEANGLSIDAHIGHSILDLFPTWVQTLEPVYRQVLDTGQPLVNLEMSGDDPRHPGETGHWLVSYQPILTPQGKANGIGYVAIDVSDRKRAEAALSQSEAKFRQLAENIKDVFWIADIANQQVLYVSPAFETLWGRTCDSLYQNYDTWLEAIHPDDRPQIEQTLRDQLPTTPFDLEYRVRHPDGSIRWVRDRAFPIRNETGDIVRMAGIAEDITERQQLETIKNEFISVVSHELRTPLTSIQMALGLLQTGVYAAKPDKAQRMIDIALSDTNRLVNLVNDILDLERLTVGRANLERTHCPADSLIQQAIAGLQSIATQHQITLRTRPSPATVWADPDAISQTLTNLLSNAIKFSPADSVIEVFAIPQPQHVLFQVIDRGRGIPADKLESIFGRFQQVDASDSREKGGTGLGLSICRSIIEQHGGKIWVESSLGAGSTFSFTLPSSQG